MIRHLKIRLKFGGNDTSSREVLVRLGTDGLGFKNLHSVELDVAFVLLFTIIPEERKAFIASMELLPPLRIRTRKLSLQYRFLCPNASKAHSYASSTNTPRDGLEAVVTQTVTVFGQPGSTVLESWERFRGGGDENGEPMELDEMGSIEYGDRIRVTKKIE